MSPVIQVTSVSYPESDGRPLGETDTHRQEMVRQIQILERFFAGQPVYVSGNPKYFLFDPTQDYLDPPLQGHRIVGGRYERMPPDSDGSLISRELGLRLQAGGEQLMFFRLDTGQRLLSPEEALREAEAELAHLREELRRARGN